MHTNNNNNKIEKASDGSVDGVVYYVNNSAGWEPIGTLFKLKQVKADDKADVSVSYARGSGNIEYSVFTSANDIINESITASDVKKLVTGEIMTAKLANTSTIYNELNLVSDYTAEEDGWIYVYIGTEKASGDTLEDGRLAGKFQMNIDKFIVNITSDTSSGGDSTEEPTATPTAEPTSTPTAEPTATPTAEPTSTPTAEPTATPTAEPTSTPTAEPTSTPTATPTAVPDGFYHTSVEMSEENGIAVEVRCPEEKNENAVMYVALYDADHKLIKLYMTSDFESVNIFDWQEGTAEAKAFIWDDLMRSLSK